MKKCNVLLLVLDKGRTTKRVTGSIAGSAEHVYANNYFVYRKMP